MEKLGANSRIPRFKSPKWKSSRRARLSLAAGVQECFSIRNMKYEMTVEILGSCKLRQLIFSRFCDVDNDGDFDDVDDLGEDDSKDKQGVELRALSPVDLSGAFILLFMGLCAAFLICVVEIIFEHITRDRRDTVGLET